MALTPYIIKACPHVDDEDRDHPVHMCGVPRCLHLGQHRPWECPGLVASGTPLDVIRWTDPDWSPPARSVQLRDLVLIHNNSAVLSLVSQVSDALTDALTV